MPNNKRKGLGSPKTLMLLRALATPLRLRLLVLLRGQRSSIAFPLIVAELRPYRASTSNVCEQLQILVTEGLVQSERVGRKVFYSLAPGIKDAVRDLEALAKSVGHEK